MRRLRRLTLSPAATKTLAGLQRKVNRAPDPSAEAQARWPKRCNSTPRRQAFEEVRRKLRRMAPGRERCMYCEDSEGTDIDHFRPKSHYPGYAFKWPNYLYACSRCNSNEKRNDFPLDATGEPLLIDPTADDPVPHFQLVPETGQLVPLSPKGESTAQVFGLNRREVLTKGRQHAWTTLLELLRAYDDAASKGETRRVKALEKAIRETPFSCVLSCLVRMATAPATPVPGDVRKIIKCRPEVGMWL